MIGLLAAAVLGGVLTTLGIGAWWDGDMTSKDQRVLLGRSLQGGRDRRRRPTDDGLARAQRRKGAAVRGRQLAEQLEGVSGRHDQSDLGTGDFGRLRLWRWNEHWKDKRAGRYRGFNR